MPAKAAWLLKIPEIMAMLEAFDVPVVDRPVLRCGGTGRPAKRVKRATPAGG